ncbi:S8 family peptidase [Halegenticoccus soli]|uniref:S8 family peptidase n=1 Tax=Halegenticoccus soli TaxID=1985678 RepID=UPI000C6ED3E9|nr:S8 family peptidase [Halegenticoccus soli]
MSRTNDIISRRKVLQLTGGSVSLAATTGLASAESSETVEVNVGYAAESGRRAAKREAKRVVREFASIDAVTVEVNRNALSGLRKRNDVRYAEENGRMHAIAQTLPWGVDRVDGDVAEAYGYTGSGADVAIIDTGIDSDHPDLVDNLGSGAYAVACSGSGCNYGWDDDNGHGTHCAGIAAAVDNSRGVVGVATNPTLHAVKVLDSRGGGSYSDIAAGIEYVADQGWDVASLSLGGGKSYTVEDAVEYAYSRGVLLVAAAGNSGPCSDCVGYPAAEPECIAVSATTSSDSLASFSSTGPEVELAAPGQDIYSTYVGGGYTSLDGTSMACPHVSGVGGLLMAEGYANTEARQRMRDTAEDVGLSSNEQGYGLVDAAAALGL